MASSVERIYRSVLCATMLFMALGYSASVLAGSPSPPQAVSAGYTQNTFESYFAPESIDIENSKNDDFQWYVGKFFGWDPAPSSNFDVPENGPLTIKTGKNSNFSIATATRVKGSRKWVGQAFGGGGYFEAEIRFNPATVLKPNRKGWPSFWAMAIEHLANLPEEQWHGQEKGYAHFIEVDILEYLFNEPDNQDIYGANMHDWFGKWKESCAPKQFCRRSVSNRLVRKRVPEGTDFNEFHKYGFLWIPATEETRGSGQFYFDDQPIGSKITWELYKNQQPSMWKQPWTFGVLDQQHLVLILGTGKDQPMEVRSVRVWQKSDKDNWKK